MLLLLLVLLIGVASWRPITYGTRSSSTLYMASGGGSGWRSAAVSAASIVAASSSFAYHNIMFPLATASAAAAAAVAAHPSAAVARNLPTSNGATGAQRGQPTSLVPVLIMQRSVATAATATRTGDLAACSAALEGLPASETAFKKVFDEHSEGVSYKQEFLDKNAFLVYYTQGFDGPGRPSIEEDDPASAKEKRQFGARNDAWVAVDEARSEVAYLLQTPSDTDTKDLTKALAAASKAFADYVAVDSPEVITAAEALL